MPSEPSSVTVILGFDRGLRLSIPLDALTAAVRAYRKERMVISREDLKRKRLAAMGVVGAQMDASAAMYDRIVEAGDIVRRAREHAERAHMGALEEQVSDLREMAEEYEEFAQAVPQTGGTNGKAPSAGTGTPAAGTVKPAPGSAALESLMAAQPNPPKQSEGGADGNAYRGTAPPKL